MIKIENLCKSFSDKILFNQASFCAENNTIIAIKGNSGIGKTTLLNMIGLLEPMDFGEYFLDGNRVFGKPKEIESIRCRTFSYLFQNPNLIPYLSVFENIVLPLRNKKIKFSPQNIIDLTDKLHISDLMDKKIEHLSGGEKTRIAIARAVVTKNPVLLADEPTGNLDPQSAEEVMKIFSWLKAELQMTILIVSHNNNLDDYYDKIYLIEQGKINEYR